MKPRRLLCNILRNSGNQGFDNNVTKINVIIGNRLPEQPKKLLKIRDIGNFRGCVECILTKSAWVRDNPK